MNNSSGTRRKSNSDKQVKGEGTARPKTVTDSKSRVLRDDVQEFKRSVILRAATDLFYEKGYQNTTVDDVAGAMSVSKAVVYWNFDSKLELLEAIVARTARMATEIVNFIQPKRTPVANLAELCFRLAAHYLKYRKEVAVHLFERRNLSDDLKAKSMERQTVLVNALVGVLEDGVRSGDFSPMDCELVAYDIISMITMSFDWRWHEEAHLHSSQSLSRHFAEQALRLAGYVGPFPFDDSWRVEQMDLGIPNSPEAVAGEITVQEQR